MTIHTAFPEIVKTNEPLAPYTHLKIGGPAQFLVEPRSVEELRQVLQHCKQQQLPLRMLGGGYNLLVGDAPIPGVVLRLQHAAFAMISAENTTVRAGGGAMLFDLIATTVATGLGGLETLVGIRGTVGGSVRCNVGDRNGEIGSSVRRVAVMHDDGTEHIRNRDDLTFSDHRSDLDEPVILWVEFELLKEKPEALLKRMRRAWIQRKAQEPLTLQAAVRLFRQPQGQSAAKLIERAGMAKYRIGGAELSDRNPNYVVAHAGTTAQDILTLMEIVQARVFEHSTVKLERELNIW